MFGIFFTDAERNLLSGRDGVRRGTQRFFHLMLEEGVSGAIGV